MSAIAKDGRMLSAREREFLPFDLDDEVMWLYEALERSRIARIALRNLAPQSRAWMSKDNDRARALFAAHDHLHNLRRDGWQMTADIAAMLKAEGL